MKIFSFNTILKTFSFLVLLGFNACIEEIEIDRDTENQFLVVEGLITDQKETQAIKLSRGFDLNEQGPFPVSGARVTVESSKGEIFIFNESDPGVYKSQNPFATTIGTTYHLNFEISGNSYKSLEVKAQDPTKIAAINSSKTKFREDTGVAILVSSSDVSGSYYKYEYEETYKIKSKYNLVLDVLLDENDSLVLVNKTKEEYICYNTRKSNEIILSDSESLESNDINHLVRFINMDNFILSYRYSILLRQLKITGEIYSYYQNLKELSEADNIFSQYQPGFLQGNIFPVDNQAENVIGVFGTASVDEKRHFFSYEDFFDLPENLRPTQYGICEPFTDDIEVLKDLIESGEFKYFDVNPLFPPIENLYLVNAQCVDCNYFGTNVKPEFWEE